MASKEKASPGPSVVSFTLPQASAAFTRSASGPGSVNLARLATATASGEENGGLAPRFAIDGDPATRWGSRHRDGEWICLDFGKERTISRCVIDWENARAETYLVEVATEGGAWRTVATGKTDSAGRVEHSFASVRARRLRITGLTRNTDYGISIFEIDVR